MSRETKIGLLVAGAFVSLLTVVVINRLLQEDEDSPMTEATVVVRATTKPLAQSKPPESTTPLQIKQGILQADNREVGLVNTPPTLPEIKAVPISVDPLTGAPILPAPQVPLGPLPAGPVSVVTTDVVISVPPGTTMLPREQSKLPALEKQDLQPGVVNPSLVSLPNAQSPALKPFPGTGGNALSSSGVQPGQPIQTAGVQGIDLKDNKPLPAPLPSQVAPVQPQLAVPAANTVDKQAEELAKIIAQQEKAEKDQKAKPEPEAKAKAPLPPLSLGGPPPISPPPGNELSPVPPLQPTPVKSPGQVGGLTPFNENKGVALPPAFGDTSPTMPPKKLDVQAPVTPPVSLDPVQKPITPVQPVSLDPVQKPINPVQPGSTGGIAPLAPVGIGPTEVPPPPTPIIQTKPVDPLPNLGSSPNVSVPVISVATPPIQATQPPATHKTVVVKSIEVLSHVWLPEDKSFADLSKRFYQSERYAAALLEYNRKDHRASPGLLQNPPQLQPGMTVYVPPWDKLQESFPHLIPQQQTLAPAAVVSPGISVEPSSTSLLSPAIPAVSEKMVPVTTVPVSVVSPPPLASTPVAPPLAKTLTPVSATTAVEGTRQYQVQGQGEPMVEIARRMLGDEMRWGEIYRLNPTIDPRYPVPAGTTLRMP